MLSVSHVLFAGSVHAAWSLKVLGVGCSCGKYRSLRQNRQVVISSVFRHHATQAIAWGLMAHGPRGTRFLQMGIENPHFFGPMRNWVNTGLPISLKTNNTVIDTCVVLSPYFCVNGELEAVLIN